MSRSHLVTIVSLCALGCGPLPTGHELAGELLEPIAWPECRAGESTIEATGAVLTNPHMGFQSFHRLDGELERDAYPASTQHYERFYWRELEPERGAIDFERLDALFDAAAERGQSVAFRLMTADTARREIPEWLDVEGVGYTSESGDETFMPDFEDPVFLDELERVLRALGARYDGDPRLSHVDVGAVGYWGEWHALENEQVTLPEGAAMRRIVDAHVDAFPSTPKVMLLGHHSDGAAPLEYALSRGAGWRADCWGDIASGWNHHDDFYAARLARPEVEGAWTSALVALETCGEFDEWGRTFYSDDQVRWILRWALDQHASLINAKSKPVPERWRPMVDAFLTRVGYRFVPRCIELVARGGVLDVGVTWFNAGVAPTYHGWSPALRVLDASGRVLARSRLDVNTDDWMPGESSRTEWSLELPADASGTLRVQLGLVGEDGEAAIALPVALERDGRWYEVGRVELR